MYSTSKVGSGHLKRVPMRVEDSYYIAHHNSNLLTKPRNGCCLHVEL